MFGKVWRPSVHRSTFRGFEGFLASWVAGACWAVAGPQARAIDPSKTRASRPLGALRFILTVLNI